VTAFSKGLVVGKFCPLHRGHEYLLDRAQAACGQLIILSYTKPEFPGCEPERRERWLRELYPDAVRLVLDDARLAQACRHRGLPVVMLPDNDAPDDTQRRFVAWVLRHLLDTAVDAVFTSESYGEGFAAVLSSEQQGAGGPSVAHVMVDQQRQAVPVSGATIRADVHGSRAYLAPEVYRDFVGRVAILGGESTGKSTLAVSLAERLSTFHAAEYGRELWEAKHGALVKDDMLHIAQTQVAREETLALQANRFLICDTTPLTTALYSEVMFGEVVDELVMLSGRAYDHVLLCSPDVPFVQDGTRRDEAFRQWQHAWYVRELQARGIRYGLLSGGWEARLAAAQRWLAI
jgi:NadR type nicotinamide-nucleotide adenylyltransferase